MSDYNRYLTAVSVVPCPRCDGVVYYGDVLTNPPDYEYRGHFLECRACGWEAEQLTYSTDEDLPDEFFDSVFHLVGWSLNGVYVNCCEGPVREGGWGNHP